MDMSTSPEPWWVRASSTGFAKDATLILVGPRGVGKSTLAVIAAMALRRRFIDLVTTFETLAGISAEAYMAKYGLQNYHQKESELLRSILDANPTNCIIATSSSAVVEPNLSVLLSYVDRFPIIHIVRCDDEVSEFLRSHPDHDEIMRNSAARLPLYRQCSVYEFVNLGKRYLTGVNPGEDWRPIGLKKLEHDFLRMLQFIYGKSSSDKSEAHMLHPSNVPAWNPVEENHENSRALLLPFYNIAKEGIDIEDVASGAEALEIRVDLMALYALAHGEDPFMHIAEQVAYLRRVCDLPILYNFAKSFFNVRPHLNLEHEPDWNQLYIQLLSHGIRLNCEYIKVWIDLLPDAVVSRLISNCTSTRIIGCFTTSVWDAAKISKQLQRSFDLGCQVTMLTSYALTLKDNFALLGAIDSIKTLRTPSKQVIAYNNGPLGKMSRCINPILTPVDHMTLVHHPNSFYSSTDTWTAEFDPKSSDILTAKDVFRALYSLFTLQHLKFYRFGASDILPDIHAIYQKAADAIGLLHKFAPLEDADQARIVEIFSSGDFGGATIVPPLASAIMTQLTTATNETRLIETCNVVVAVRDSGSFHQKSLHGDNTDWRSVQTCILDNLAPWQTISQDTTALLLGAGVDSKPSILALFRLGVRNVYVYDPNPQDAHRLASEVSGVAQLRRASIPEWKSMVDEASSAVWSMRYIARKDDLLKPDTTRPKNFGSLSFEGAESPNVERKIHVLESLAIPWPQNVAPPTIIINCSMEGIPIPDNWLSTSVKGLAIDIQVRQRETTFVTRLNSHGWRVVDGVSLFTEKVFLHFELLTGTRAPRSVIKEAIQDIVARVATP